MDTNRLTRIGGAGATCPQGTCECTPPEDSTVTASLSATGTVSVSIPRVGDVTGVEAVDAPEWLAYELQGDNYVFSGQSDAAAHCATYRVTSECGEAIWVVKIPAQCVLPKATAPDIVLDSGGQTTTSITFNTNITLGATTGLTGASVSVIGKTLTIVGSPPAGAYSIVVSNDCGEVTLSGDITAVPPVPPCDFIRVGAPEGTFSATIGEEVNLCFPLQGSLPIAMNSVEGLPAGLTAVVTTDASGKKLCITGTVVEDKCAGAEGCRQGKVVLSNCAGEVEVVPKIYISAPPAPRPPFCVGMVMHDGVGEYQAAYFPPGSILYVDTVQVNGTPVVLDTIEVTMDGQGFATFQVPTLAVSGCPAPQLQVLLRHATCAIATNRVVTRSYTGGDNCNPGP